MNIYQKKNFFDQKKIFFDQKKISSIKKKISSMEEHQLQQIGGKRKRQDTGIVMNKIKENYSYKWERLSFEYDRLSIFDGQILDLDQVDIFDFWENNFDIDKKLHFYDGSYIHYGGIADECKPFILRFENINGIVERNENDRYHYFTPTSLLQTSLIHGIFAKIEDNAREILKIDYNTLMDLSKFQIRGGQKLPLKTVVYFRNLIVYFEEVKKITVRRREKHQIVARVISGEILLNKK